MSCLSTLAYLYFNTAIYAPHHRFSDTSDMPEVSYEALAGAALLVVLAVGYQYIPKGALDGVAGAGANGSSSSKNKKKNKKKGKGAASGGAGSKEEVAGTSAEETDTAGPTAPTSAKGKGKKGKSASNSSTPTASQTFAKVAKEPNGSQEGELAPHQGQEQGRKPKTLAERLAPKSRKSKVDE